MLNFELVTLDGTKISEEVYEVLLPTPQGQVGVLPHHIPLVTIAVPGVISVRKHQNDPDNQMEVFATNGGAIEVINDMLRVLVDEADKPEDINEQEARKAYERARQLLREAKDQVELEEAHSLLQRHAVRLKVAEIRRHRRH